MKTLLIDSVTGREFLLEKKLSSGKFGRVFLVISRGTREPFILKEIKPLNREVLPLLETIRHPALLTSTEQITLDGNHFLLRRYQEGMSLKEVVTKRRLHHQLSLRFWVEGFIFLLEGLDHLHNHQLIHRDIKPANILLTKTNIASTETQNHDPLKLLDFEQALIVGSNMQYARAPFALCYSPPEQLLNLNNLTGPWSDLFALALTLYEAVCRKPAFWFHDPEMLMHLQLNQPLKKERIPDGLFDILAKATSRIAFRLPPRLLSPPEISFLVEKGIGQRYKSAGEMIDDLKQFLNDFSGNG